MLASSNRCTVSHLPESDEHPEHPFATEPLEERRWMYELFSQETRYYILQVILGHPDHLVSLAEFDFFIPKSKPAINDQLRTLSGPDVITDYSHPPNESYRDYPSTFWGLTEKGVDLLYQFNFLHQTPVLRALFDVIRLDSTRQRHLEAPRPSLPPVVEETLSFDEDDGESVDPDQILEQFASDEDIEQSTSRSIVPEITNTNVEGPSGENPLDDLF